MAIAFGPTACAGQYPIGKGKARVPVLTRGDSIRFALTLYPHPPSPISPSCKAGAFCVWPLYERPFFFGLGKCVIRGPMRLEMQEFQTTNEPRKLPWWRRSNDFTNPTLDALLTLFGVMVIIAVIYLFSR